MRLVDGVEVLDKYNVRFILNAANAGLLAAMADPHWGAIVNRETVEKHGDLHKVAVGTGPFILDEWKPEQETRLRRNPDYFEKGQAVPRERDAADRVRTRRRSSPGCEAGAIHHALLEDPRSYEAVKGSRPSRSTEGRASATTS